MKFRAIAGVALIIAAMVWLAARSDDWKQAYAFTGREGNYYNYLMHGFLRGHLYMDLAVDPALLSPDPEVRRHAPFPPDASLYRGRFYLYFGIVPAALVLLPYHLLTGQDLSENAACAAIVLCGFLLYLRIYAEARRRYFPALSLPLRAASLLLLAFGTGTPVLLMNSNWYEIAIAGGYACMAAAWLGIFRALHSERHAVGWLGLASAASGLAVGCRPTYVLALPMLAAAAFWLTRDPGRPRAGATRLRLAVAAILPAGFVGVLLAAYNYARFGNPLEFGLRYKLGDPSGGSVAYFFKNLTWYYLRPSDLAPYFPYVFPINTSDTPPGYVCATAFHGQWPAFLLALLCGAWLLSSRLRGHRPPAALGTFLLLVLGGFACVFAGLACFGGRTDRYVPDFQGSLALVLTLAGGFCAGSNQPAGAWPRAWRVGFATLATATGLFNIFVSLELGDRFLETRPGSYNFLAYYGNYPGELLNKAGLLRYGPIEFTFEFAPVAKPTAWPLLATGVPFSSDVLYVIQHPQGLAQFMLRHEGHREVRSRLIPIAVGHPYKIEADLGSLYPPALHPYFRSWEAKDVEALKSRALVRFDGETVIHQKTQFYDSPQHWVLLGQNPGNGEAPFSGKILASRRLAPTGPGPRLDVAENGVWRLQFVVPVVDPQIGHPILGSGTQGHGNLLLMDFLPDGKIRFGLDQWNFAMAHSVPRLLANPGLHRLEIFVGPQVARRLEPAGWQLDPGALARSKNIVRVWLDGELAWTTTVSVNLDTYDEVALGNNPQGFSTAEPYFLGSLDNFPYSPSEMQEFIEKNLRLPVSGTKP